MPFLLVNKKCDLDEIKDCCHYFTFIESMSCLDWVLTNPDDISHRAYVWYAAQYN